MSTTTTKTTAPAKARRAGVPKPLPAYGIPDGLHSLRSALTVRECNALDRALSIVGARLRAPGAACDCPAAVRAYLGLQLGGERCERFAVLYLDSQIRAIAYECHFTGTLTQTSVHPREIVEAALNHRAAAVILAHNHPSGVTQPSRADEVLTRALKEALALVDVRVLDHVIVAGAQSLSMAEEGLL
ncbi:hypothetical protein MRB47_05280 [Diaphorobacter sp. LI3]|nr:hypothetical protein MRB47_05280 [Diaphorobacter sp. LI3]